MTSPSASATGQRPFYGAYSDAYDNFIADPVAPWTDAVRAGATTAGMTNATLLDAGHASRPPPSTQALS